MDQLVAKARLAQLRHVREPTEAELAQASAEIECERCRRDPRPIPIRPAGWAAPASTPGWCVRRSWVSLNCDVCYVSVALDRSVRAFIWT